MSSYGRCSSLGLVDTCRCSQHFQPACFTVRPMHGRERTVLVSGRGRPLTADAPPSSLRHGGSQKIEYQRLTASDFRPATASDVFGAGVNTAEQPCMLDGDAGNPPGSPLRQGSSPTTTPRSLSEPSQRQRATPAVLDVWLRRDLNHNGPVPSAWGSPSTTSSVVGGTSRCRPSLGSQPNQQVRHLVRRGLVLTEEVGADAAT